MAAAQTDSERTRLLGDGANSDNATNAAYFATVTNRPPSVPTVSHSVNVHDGAAAAVPSTSRSRRPTPPVSSTSVIEGGSAPAEGAEALPRRRPYHYYQVPGTNRYKSDSGTDASDTEVTNYNRFTYISRVMSANRLQQHQRRLSAGQEVTNSDFIDEDIHDQPPSIEAPPHFTIPSHLIPLEFFIPYIAQTKSGQQPSNSSLVTIFAIWNTMMGTSILSMPWLVEQSGLVTSVVAFVSMTIVCLFTAYRILTMHSTLRVTLTTKDFQCIMRDTLSVRWEYVGIFFSVLILSGAMLVYWVLMSNFLFNSVEYFHNLVEGNFQNFSVVNNHGAFCLESNISSNTNSSGVFLFGDDESLFSKLWRPSTAPIFLILFLLPVLNVKSPTFFTKFTGLGTISVLYITIFVTVKACQFGVNANFNDSTASDYIHLFRWNFPVALGTLSLAMFIHNCICCIMENNHHQENNVRDLVIAYTLVFITYFYIGVLFYIAWPFAKTCIRDNFLDNFIGTDVMTVVARVFLFFQMYTVFPLLGYMVRAQLFNAVYGLSFPGRWHVLSLNMLLVTGCVLVAIFYPFIGQLLRFSGAICGMAWIFTFPCVVYLVGQYRRDQLKLQGSAIHISLIALGVAILVLQFVITPD